MTRTLWRNVVIKIILNINIRSVLIFDRNLVDGDKVIRSSCFSAYCDGGRGCHSAVLRGNHHCDVVWWSRWSKLGGAARDVVGVAARSVRWSEGMYLAPSHGEAKALGHVQPRSGAVGDLPCLREGSPSRS